MAMTRIISVISIWCENVQEFWMNCVWFTLSDMQWWILGYEVLWLCIEGLGGMQALETPDNPFGSGIWEVAQLFSTVLTVLPNL